jgi:hypothetical protein
VANHLADAIGKAAVGLALRFTESASPSDVLRT